MKNPKVTIYIPTKNRRDLLERAVRSVHAQTMDNWELIVVNDASTDTTRAYLEQLVNSDERIKAFHNDTSKGACYCRNLAIRHANAELVTGLDDDDEFMPKRLERMLDVYTDDYSFICTSQYWVTHDSQEEILAGNREITLPDLFSFNYVGNQVLVRKDRLLKIGGFDEDFVSLQDYDCFVRLVAEFGTGYRLGEPLMKLYVDHPYDRISSGERAFIGYQQFRAKHQQNISKKDLRTLKMLMLARKYSKWHPLGLWAHLYRWWLRRSL